MALTYEEIMAPRRARWSSETKGQAELMGQAYDFGIQVWTLREKLGLTQAELAERCGIDQDIIKRIEDGVTSPTDRALARVTAELVQRCDIGQDDIKRIESDITDPAARALVRLAAVLHAGVSHPDALASRGAAHPVRNNVNRLEQPGQGKQPVRRSPAVTG